MAGEQDQIISFQLDDPNSTAATDPCSLSHPRFTFSLDAVALPAALAVIDGVEIHPAPKRRPDDRDILNVTFAPKVGVEVESLLTALGFVTERCFGTDGLVGFVEAASTAAPRPEGHPPPAPAAVRLQGQAALEAVMEGHSVCVTGCLRSGLSTWAWEAADAVLQRGDTVAVLSTTEWGATFLQRLAPADLAADTPPVQSLARFLGGGATSDKWANAITANPRLAANWSTACLIVDDVSCLSPDTLRRFAEVRPRINPTMQIVLVGDFWQVPPMTKSFDETTRYCFEEDCWDTLISATFVLEPRGQDSPWHRALSGLRTAKLTASDIGYLMDLTERDAAEPDALHVVNTTTEATKHNAAQMQQLRAETGTVVQRYPPVVREVVVTDRGKKTIITDQYMTDSGAVETVDRARKWGDDNAEIGVIHTDAIPVDGWELVVGCRVTLTDAIDPTVAGLLGTVRQLADDAVTVAFDGRDDTTTVTSITRVRSWRPFVAAEHGAKRPRRRAPTYTAAVAVMPLMPAFAVPAYKMQGVYVARLVYHVYRPNRNQVQPLPLYNVLQRCLTPEGAALRLPSSSTAAQILVNWAVAPPPGVVAAFSLAAGPARTHVGPGSSVCGVPEGRPPFVLPDTNIDMCDLYTTPTYWSRAPLMTIWKRTQHAHTLEQTHEAAKATREFDSVRRKLAHFASQAEVGASP